MKIELRRSGGFAGNIRRPPLTLDTAGLAPEQAEEIEALVADLGDDPRPARGSPRGADMMSYELAIEAGGKRRTVRFDEAGATPELRSLVSRVEELSRRG